MGVRKRGSVYKKVIRGGYLYGSYSISNYGLWDGIRGGGRSHGT